MRDDWEILQTVRDCLLAYEHQLSTAQKDFIRSKALVETLPNKIEKAQAEFLRLAATFKVKWQQDKEI